MAYILPEEDSSLAAVISAVADGYPAGADEKAVIELALITRLLEGKATWAQIGAVQGVSGREAKRRAHKLRLRVQRLAVTADAGGSEEKGGGTPVRVPHIDFDAPTGNPQVAVRKGYGLTPLCGRKG